MTEGERAIECIETIVRDARHSAACCEIKLALARRRGRLESAEDEVREVLVRWDERLERARQYARRAGLTDEAIRRAEGR